MVDEPVIHNPVAPVPAAAAANAPPTVVTLPARIVLLPTFTGEPFKGEKRLPISATKHFLDRVHAHFEAYAHQYPSDALRLNALYGCFPQNSVAAIWFGLQRPAFGTFDDFEHDFEVEYGPTDTEVIGVEQTFLSFTQREGHSVRQYYTNYQKLLAELSALERVYSAHLVRGNWVNGLRQPVQREVLRVYRRDPTLSLAQLLHESEIEVQQFRNRPRGSRFNRFDHKSKPKSNNKRWACFYCKTNDHTHQNCQQIAAKKAAGTWRE